MNYLEKLYRKLRTCRSVNKNFCGKLVTLLEPSIIFDKRFKATPVPFLFLISVY